MCCISGVWATIHTSSWTFLRSLIAQRYAFSSPCAPCVTYFCQFSYQFSLFFIVFVYIEWNKHSLSSPRRGVVPEEWWGPMRRSDDQEIWRNMLEKQALPNFRPSSQFLICLCPSNYPSLCFTLSYHLSVSLSGCPFVYLPVLLSVCLSFCKCISGQ